MPTAGRRGRSARMDRGATALATAPAATGASTSRAVVAARPAAPTPTDAARRWLASAGTASAAPSVEAVVMATDSATSPPAMWTHRLDAWPPEMRPSSSSPARWPADSPATDAMADASAGMTP